MCPKLPAISSNLLLDNHLEPADIVMGPRWVHDNGQVMGTLFKRGRNWYIDVRDQGRRIRKRVGPSKEVAILALKDAEVKIAREAGIKDLSSIHAFRHTFATQLLQNGVQFPELKEILGHKDINTTLMYLHFAPDHLASAVDKMMIKV